MAEYIEQVSRIVTQYKELDVPLPWLKKTFLSHLPWDEIDKIKGEQNINDEIDKPVIDPMAGMNTPGGMM
jgi:hypothetical protein